MYKKFAITLFVSFCVMYGVMFLNVDDASHVYLSLTRLYMALLMVAPMAIVMLLMMKKMYANKKLNNIILVCGIAVFISALTMLRQQTFVSDRQYMQAMIPHHSSAILTSKNATIKDPEVRKLADGIIESQEREIALMKQLLSRELVDTTAQ